MQCKRRMSTGGQCKKSAVRGEAFCEFHLRHKCCVCGKTAECECPNDYPRNCSAWLCEHCLCPFHGVHGE